jgi:hypothetical protein
MRISELYLQIAKQSKPVEIVEDRALGVSGSSDQVPVRAVHPQFEAPSDDFIPIKKKR